MGKPSHYVVLMLAIAFFGKDALGQSIETSINKKVITPSYEPIMKSDGTTMPEARGIWRANGYGYLAEIRENEIRLFNETSSLIWKLGDLDVDDLQISIVMDGKRAGKRALVSPNPQVPSYVVERLSSFPTKSEPETWTPSNIYRVFEETMAEQYVFFKERKFDWANRVKAIRPKITDELSEEQLFELLTETLRGIDDGHVQLGATINEEPRRPMFGVSRTEKRGYEIFQSQSEETDFDVFLEKRLQNFQNGIAIKLLGGKPRQSCNELTWGRMKSNVGYLHIASMGGFSESDSLEEQVEELHAAMNEILTKLADTRLMIVDVCTNGGGSDIFSLAIASHFTDQRRLAFTKGPRNSPDIQHAVYLEPNKGKSAATYTKPVRLVINDVTMSAAEIFVLCMKDLPNVTTVGKSTRGALSDVLSKTLPNGWAFGLSNEIYYDSKGKCFEAIGIPPDHKMEIIDPTKLDLGHAATISKVANLSFEAQ